MNLYIVYKYNMYIAIDFKSLFKPALNYMLNQNRQIYAWIS